MNIMPLKCTFKMVTMEPGTAVHTCNSSTYEVDTRGPGTQGHPQPHSKVNACW